ncbi:MAG: transporter [Alphaproteobacteria bacterium]|nr:transporter [Alphaproteobacteria bacterium]
MKKLLTFTALASVLAIANANAAGFHLREQSGAALGNAFAGATAGAENNSYAYFNAAGLTRHKGKQFNIGGTYIAPEASAHNIKTTGSGETSDVHNIVHSAIAPNMSYSQQIDDKFTFGLGINVPFGMVTKYDDSWAGAADGVTSKVTTVTTTPMIAYKATDKLSLGVGLPIQYFKAKLTSNPGFDVKIEGDTVDVGYQFSALYELSDKTRFGVNYRSEINHKLKGEVESNNSPYAAVHNQDITARIDTPAMLSVGAYHEINDKWAVMAEYQRVFWNSFDAIDIYGADTHSLVSNTPENWEDTDFYSVGASYQIDDQWKLRLGLAYDEAAVKVDYRTPRVPDSRRIWYSTGLEYKYNDNLTFDMGFTYIQAKEARVEFKGGSADYENSVKIWGLSVNYKF